MKTDRDRMMDEHSSSFQCREVWGGNQNIEQDITIGSLQGFLLSIPYESGAGGDIHFLSFCEEAKLAKIIVADVAGHGDIASRAALELKGLLQKHIDELDNRILLESINDALGHRLRNGKFVTMVAATFHTVERTFIYAYAGHPALLHYTRANGRWHPLHAGDDGGVPLGIAGDIPYYQMKTVLRPGDMILFYTDGLLNVKTDSHPQISPSELLSLCQKTVAIHPRPRPFAMSLLTRIKELSAAGLSDDVTLLAVEVT